MRTYKFYLQVDTLFFLIISHIDFDGVPSSKNQEEMQRPILPFETTDQRKRSMQV